MSDITIDSEVFHELIKQVVDRIKEEEGIKENKWIRTEIAMELLGIKSKTTLQKLRDEGKIRFTQPYKKIILYDRQSIIDHLENHAQEIN